jgi:hypothetical protein
VNTFSQTKASEGRGRDAAGDDGAPDRDPDGDRQNALQEIAAEAGMSA